MVLDGGGDKLSEAVWIALIPVVGTILVNLISILPKMKENQADSNKRIEALSDDIKAVKSEFDKYKAADDDRYAQSVRVRILGFDDKICAKATPYPKENRWKQALVDCDTYENYLKSHPDFINGIGADAIESIRTKYRYVKDNSLFGEMK